MNGKLLNFSSLKSVAYPASWITPRYHFGQDVLYLGERYTITGMRYCQAFVNVDGEPVMEWHYEIDHEAFVPAEALEPVTLLEVA